jgi:NAD-dependent SIR2 family protein deacetylase
VRTDEQVQNFAAKIYYKTGSSVIINTSKQTTVMSKPTTKTAAKRLTNSNPLHIHGHKGDETWKTPRLAAESDKACRKDQNNNIKANEYLDEPDVLEAKIKIIADLVRQSKCCVAYTGAGLSKASGIPDYATKATNSVVSNAPKLASSLDAVPTYAHRVITSMERKGHIQHYVQQNHDGLPQKSGFPQHKMNEIHGAWFDPSNPVVKFSGSLRTDLFDWLLEMEEKADLCLCLGTSLSGMNADRMANTPADKMLENLALGTVIINLQQTPLDEKCAIRVWAKLDDAFKLLVKELGISEKEIRDLPTRGKEAPKHYKDKFPVPYDQNGLRSDTHTMILDLTLGAKVRIAVPGACNENTLGEVAGKRDGDYSISLKEKKGAVRRVLGKWWVDEALSGSLTRLPLVNQNPQFIKK